MTQTIGCEGHPRDVKFFILPPHFVEEYMDKRGERLYLCDIRSQNLNALRKLILNICNRSLKNRKDLRFVPEKINPSILTNIINECNKIFLSSMRNYKINAPIHHYA